MLRVALLVDEETFGCFQRRGVMAPFGELYGVPEVWK